MKKKKKMQLLKRLQKACKQGFVHHFAVDPLGRMYSMTEPSKYYQLTDVKLQVLSCAGSKASVYLITPLDGSPKGTLVDFWD